MNKRLWLLLATLLTLAAGRAWPATLVYFAEPGVNGQPRWLYNFDTTTGLSSQRVQIGGTERFFGLDARPSDGVVFAVNLTDTDGNSGLYTIDINSGAVTLVGLTGADQLVGIAFHPITGELFALSNDSQFYRVNPLTGAATFIGGTAAVTRGLAFSPSGMLYGFSGSGTLFTVNPLTGAPTPVGGTGNPVQLIHEDAAFTAAGELFATDFGGRIFQTDPMTGNGMVIGDTGLGPGLLGIVAVPEPSVLLLAGLAAGTLLCFRLRRTW